MLAINSLFEIFDPDNFSMPKGAPSIGGFVKKTLGMGEYDSGNNKIYKSGAKSGFSADSREGTKSGILKGKQLAKDDHQKNMVTNTSDRRKQMLTNAGTEVKNATNATTNFVNDNQKLVGSAGLVGAGAIAHKLKNRTRQ